MMRSLEIFGIILLHLLFFCSIFDIYFKSPVVQVQKRYSNDFTPPALRLVFIVADGLRAQTFYKYWNTHAPFLKSMATQKGLFGISHTRVPTESRPGHVALIGGMYEDPSAVTKGWKQNPVDFDTVFNQSKLTLAWGSPDILPIFHKGTDKMRSHCYSPDLEDFSSDDLTILDTWVFDEIKKTFFNASNINDDRYNSLRTDLRTDGLILFLHLLGTDTNGHAHKPKSVEYINNIKVVDEGIQKIIELTDKYYRKDGRTAYIFTADHGMTDWGSHGAGMDVETQTPFVAWGSGLSRLAENVSLEQADVAPLISTLLGLPIPVNSEGNLPLNILDLHPAQALRAGITHAKQVFEQVVSYSQIYGEDIYSKREQFLRFERQIQSNSANGRYDYAKKILKKLTSNSFEGLQYFRTYHRSSLYVFVVSSYIGFMILIIWIIVEEFSFFFILSNSSKNKNSMFYIFFISSILSALFVFFRIVPYHYFFYYVSSPVIWGTLFLKVSAVSVSPSIRLHISLKRKLLIILNFSIIAGMVLTFFDRRFLVLCGLGISFLHSQRIKGRVKFLWWISNGALVCFGFQPGIGSDKSPLLVLNSGIFSTILYCYLITTFSHLKSKYLSLSIFPLLSGMCVFYSDFTLSRIISWIILISSIPLAMIMSPPKLLPRIHALSAATTSIYLLLCLSYEGVFFTFLASTLCIWLITEYNLSFSYKSLSLIDTRKSFKPRAVLEFDDIYRALALVYYCVVSFFGTGNIASINSFDPKSIANLVTIFSPFLMGFLLISKVLIPMFLVGIFANSIINLAKMNVRLLLLLVLIISDQLSLCFFFLVTDKGSWLDIGMSISHFVIAQGIVVFLFALIIIGHFLLTFEIKFFNNSQMFIK